jgi:hypothetical protein
VLADVPSTREGGLVIPVTLDDLAANGLVGEAGPGPDVCWERSLETLTARKDEVGGLAVVADDRIEAYLLYIKDGELVSLRSFVDDGGARLKGLITHLYAAGGRNLRFPKVHPGEIPKETLGTLGFRPAGVHRLYAARAKAN